jgi:hypothetical protein
VEDAQIDARSVYLVPRARFLTFARYPLAIATAISEGLLCRPRSTDRSEIVRSSAAYQRDCREDTGRKGTGDEPENGCSRHSEKHGTQRRPSLER